MKIMTIVGARPQFIRQPLVSRAIEDNNRSSVNRQIDEVLVHTVSTMMIICPRFSFVRCIFQFQAII